MRRYLTLRLLQSLVLLLLVSMIGFAILHLAPGGPMSQFMAGGEMSPEDIARVERQLGLDRPLPVQYLEWLGRMLVGDWGRSYRDQQPVLAVIGSHLGATLELMVTSTLIAMVLGCWLGVLSAIRRYSFFDMLVTVGSMVALSIPTFWFGLVVIFIFSVHLDILPAGNRYTMGDGSFLDQLHHLIAPSLVLALVSTAIWSRYMRSSMIDVLHQDFVRTARAKGIPERRILLHHTVRNALLPMITVAGLQLPNLLGGALVTETVFTWPGMGRLFLDSISYRDYPVVMGILMFTAVLVLLGSLMADLLYGVADPRLRLK
ncbi:Oligopeptide transport system permease protein oppB [Roseomonas mucosa]|uniref:ABC transporter permease n=1 Tax=Roseomonas TaxID=125216 RepID=UPI00095C1F3A|nr:MULTISPECIES: ABC transporter permease [Roseomonas]MDT8261810.1 ABC transporter permease [Roseomonas sp. DSM 102946]ATR22097.1 ABC transporter permease [Roseomonas sp. FDAARGOS_362]USQ73245.1 ABC transporter permease [Roseomonas mucosa]UZO95400.1 Oligopeptide transport system permease protein oppB [Roseomonas mucosa]GAV35663.1 Dipeptide transport system permease protein DppB [Roseomonas sp. TAS13]